MRIPDRLKIGGHEYRVMYPYHFVERGDINGQHDADLCVIKIDDRDSYSHELRSESSIAVSFLHELLHACDRVTGYGVFNGAEGEKILEGLSEVLFQVLRDNGLDFSEEDGGPGNAC